MAIAGTIVDGPEPYWKGSIATNVPEDGRDAVRRTKADGYDFVKVYNGVRSIFQDSEATCSLRPEMLI